MWQAQGLPGTAGPAGWPCCVPGLLLLRQGEGARGVGLRAGLPEGGSQGLRCGCGEHQVAHCFSSSRHPACAHQDVPGTPTPAWERVLLVPGQL